jgi:hypothetical protein
MGQALHMVWPVLHRSKRLSEHGIDSHLLIKILNHAPNVGEREIDSIQLNKVRVLGLNSISFHHDAARA